MSYGDEPLATMTNFVEHATPFTSVRSGHGAADPTHILRQPVDNNPTPEVGLDGRVPAADADNAPHSNNFGVDALVPPVLAWDAHFCLVAAWI